MSSTTEKAPSPSSELQGDIVRALRSAIGTLGHSTEGLDLTLRPIPLEGAWGFGSAVAFQLRRVGAQGNPAEIAARVAEALPELPQIERVEVVNNYVNFYVDRGWYANRVVNQVLERGAEYGCLPSRGERVMVEYANLNTHKTMHVGHLRNVVLGAAAFNILRCAGFDTVGATYLGDIGLHVIRTMWGYMNFHNGQEPAENRGAWLEKVYVEAVSRQEHRDNVVDLITDAAKADPGIAAHLALALQAMAEGDEADRPYAAKLAETLVTRDGPDWKPVLAERDHIVLNLWSALGELLVGQTSTLDTTGGNVPAVVGDRGPGGGGRDDDNSEGLMSTHGPLPTSNSALGPQPSALPEAPDPLTELHRDYEKLDARMEWWDEVPRWQAEVKELFARWERQEPDVVDVWNRTREWSLGLLKRIFGDLKVDFDAWFFESQVEEPGKEVVKELIERSIAEDLRPDGPVIVRIDEKLREHPTLGPKYEKELYRKAKDGTQEPREAWRVLVVLRSDGTSLYATKDLELARVKFSEWNVDRSVYVIDTRQSLYFQQVFRVLELWGFEQADKSSQLAYEIVTTPEGAISSRKGGAPLFEDFEKEALSRARAIVEAKEREQSRDLSDEQIDTIARAVAYGAMKMGMLDKDNNKIIVFDWERALDPDSQSASYVQYSYARATRVLEKAPAELLPKPGAQYSFAELSNQETALLETIAKLPEEVERAAEAYKPVIIATYCFEMADAFNNFYHNCPILRAGDDNQVRARLALTAAARQSLANALGLLGIDAPEMM
jgi:arginyl-tRNA synthetase